MPSFRLPRPEIEEAAGCVSVRFRPSRYVPPQRIGHELSETHRQILHILGSGQGLALRDIFSRMERQVTLRKLRKDLGFLKDLGLIDSSGHGKGARWFLRGHPK